MSTLSAVALGLVIGLGVSALWLAWGLWTTRLNTLGDYLLAALVWWQDRRRKGR